MRRVLRFACLACLAVSGTAVSAGPGTERSAAEPGGRLTLRWATTLVTSVNVIKPRRCLGPPDGQRASFLGTPPVRAAVAGFRDGEPSRLDPDALAALLRLDRAALEGMDFVAFEHNNGPGDGEHFESGAWTFDDGTARVTLVFDHFHPRSCPFILAVRRIKTRRYCDTFGFPDTFGGGDIQCLLFHLPGLNLEAPDFTVTLQASGDAYYGSPDPDAMGIIESRILARLDPEPGSGEGATPAAVTARSRACPERRAE